ncbi:MAG: response regulator [Deltaproteobacteria bacterium]|nr:response regulator [Deltaproteobacteria bacterium]
MGKKKALVIDDERIVLESVKKILEGSYDIEVTLSGKQGLEWAVQKDYDVVLTDIRMPEKGGMHVLRDIKRAKPMLPVMMMTGYASVNSAVQAMKLGAADYIEKPFAPDELIKAVDLAIEKSASRPPDEQALVHREGILRVLERAATDADFNKELAHHGADALDEYNLNNAEKLALLTGDIPWIEKSVGSLTEKQKGWIRGL